MNFKRNPEKDEVKKKIPNIRVFMKFIPNKERSVFSHFNKQSQEATAEKHSAKISREVGANE